MCKIVNKGSEKNGNTVAEEKMTSLMIKIRKLELCNKLWLLQKCKIKII